MALQNLRDKLLKAGLVDKKQKQQVDLTDRREKKQKGAEQQAAEETERQRLFAERLAAEAEEQRQREAERAAERARHEALHRVRNICDRWAVRSSRPGKLRFYFVKSTQKLGYLLLSDAQFDQLLVGGLAICERLPADQVEPAIREIRQQGRPKRSLLAARSPSRPPPTSQLEAYVLLPPEPAEHVLEIDPTAIRFWARKLAPIGFTADPAS
jgi:hypothetical protein